MERFEDSLDIKCCGQMMKLVGNYSLREAGAKYTCVGYECKKCFKKLFITDELPMPSHGAEMLADTDDTP